MELQQQVATMELHQQVATMEDRAADHAAAIQKLRSEYEDIEKNLKAEIAKLTADHTKELDGVRQAHALELQQQISKCQEDVNRLREAHALELQQQVSKSEQDIKKLMSTNHSELTRMDEAIAVLKEDHASKRAASMATVAAEVL